MGFSRCLEERIPLGSSGLQRTGGVLTGQSQEKLTLLFALHLEVTVGREGGWRKY